MLIKMGLPPIEMTMFQLETKSQSEIIEVDVEVTEKQKTSIYKPSSPCKIYDNSESSFNQCLQTFFKEYLKKNMTCFLPGETCIFSD